MNSRKGLVEIEARLGKMDRRLDMLIAMILTAGKALFTTDLIFGDCRFALRLIPRMVFVFGLQSRLFFLGRSFWVTYFLDTLFLIRISVNHWLLTPSYTSLIGLWIGNKIRCS